MLGWWVAWLGEGGCILVEEDKGLSRHPTLLCQQIGAIQLCYSQGTQVVKYLVCTSLRTKTDYTKGMLMIIIIKLFYGTR